MKTILSLFLLAFLLLSCYCFAESATTGKEAGKDGTASQERVIRLGRFPWYYRQEDLEIQLRLVQENSYVFFDEAHYSICMCSLQTLYLLGEMGHAGAKHYLTLIEENKGMCVFDAIYERFYSDGIDQTGNYEFGQPIGASKAEMPPQLILHWEKLLKLDLEAILEL